LIDSDTETSYSFVNFVARWCRHCEEMKPTWDALMEKYEDDESTLVGSVDCEGEGKPLCLEQKIPIYPTIKFGDPAHLQVYDAATTRSR